MPILQDVPIAITAQEIIAKRGQQHIRPDLLERAKETIDLGHGLWQPAAVYDWFDVEAIDGEEIHLTCPSRPELKGALHIGPKVSLLQDAKKIMAGVGTIGPALEEYARQLQTLNEGLQSYLLDSAGVVALGALGESLRCLVQEAAAEQGWGVSAALSPGSLVGWPLRGQKDLCRLLPLAEIGTRLNKYSVLEPHKSFSVIIGLGPGYDSVHVGSVCRYCALQETCWRRREDPS